MGWLDHDFESRKKLVLLVAIAAVLAVGASIGIAAAARFGTVAHRLAHPSWVWLPIALGGEVVAYLGYILAYREVARAEHGAELELPHAAALVAAGFGVSSRPAASRSTRAR